MMAVLLSLDSATEWAWLGGLGPTALVPTGLLHCWVQTPPLRVEQHCGRSLS